MLEYVSIQAISAESLKPIKKLERLYKHLRKYGY